MILLGYGSFARIKMLLGSNFPNFPLTLFDPELPSKKKDEKIKLLKNVPLRVFFFEIKK